MRHEKNTSFLANNRFQILPSLRDKGRRLCLSYQEPVKMNGGEILILFESTPEMIQSTPLGIESSIKAAAYGNTPGKDKISGCDNPGDKDKEPGTTQAGNTVQQPIPKAIHKRKILKIRSKINLLKQAEFRQKSSQGRKWLTRSPLA
jgi:hypothetical protein